MNSSVVLSADLAKPMNPARYAYAILLAVTASNISAFFSHCGADVRGGSSSACKPRIFGIEVRLHSPIAYRPEPVIMNRTTLNVLPAAFMVSDLATASPAAASPSNESAPSLAPSAASLRLACRSALPSRHLAKS
jgi:hypothetical protein